MKEETKALSHWGQRGTVSRCGKNSWLVKKGKEKYRLLRREVGEGFAMSEAALRCHLDEMGFKHQPRLCVGAQGAVSEGKYYHYLLEHWDGASRFPFDDGYHVIAAAKVLGQFQQMMGNFDWRNHGFPTKSLLARPGRLEAMLDTGRHYKDSFRHLLPGEEMDEILARGERSLTALCSSLYETAVEQVLSQGGICYGAVRKRGLMFFHGEPLLTDFSKLSEDLSIVDLWQLLRRYLSYEGSRGEVIQSAIAAYEGQVALRPEEKSLLIYFLCFPYTLLRIMERLEKDKANDRLRREALHVLRAECSHKSFYQELEQEGRYEHCH